ncbi:MAG: molecular chaperone DnaJ [Pseudomonadota bacterium]
MLRFAIILAIVCLLYRWAMGQWPWQTLKLPPTRAQVLADARKLLEVEPDASRQTIIGAHKRRIAKIHPDRGGSGDAVHEANEARDLLLGALPPRTDPADAKDDG